MNATKIETTRGILAGWLADGSGRALSREQFIEIRDGKILGIRPADGTDCRAPGVIDWSDGMVIPGLIDAHVHLFMSGTSDPEIRQQQLAASYEDLKGVIARHVRQHLAAGIVAVRDGGDYGGYALRYRDSGRRAAAQGLIIRAAGKAWRMPGRYGRLIGRPVPVGQGLAAAIQSDNAAIDHVKVVQSGLNSLKSFGRQTSSQFSAAALGRGVQAAKERGLPVMVHANGERPVGEALAAGCRSVEHGFFMGGANLERLGGQATTWVPTAVTMQGYAENSEAGSVENDISRRNLDHQHVQLRQARALGVVVAAGTDAGTIGVHHGHSLRGEIALLMSAGFSTAEALRCATANGADLLALPDLGELAPGRQATLVALQGGPAQFPHNLAAPVIMLSAGRVVYDNRV